MIFCLANLRKNFRYAIGLNYLLTVRTNTQMLGLEQQDETRKGWSEAKYMKVQEQKHFCRRSLNKRNQVQGGLRTEENIFFFQIRQFQKSFERGFFSCNNPHHSL